MGHSRRRKRAGPAHTLDDQCHQRSRMVPERRPLLVHERPGWQRADARVRAAPGRHFQGRDSGRDAQGHVRRMGARRSELLCRDKRARQALLRPV